MITLKLPSALLLAAAILPLSVSPANAAPLSQQEQLDQSRAQEAARQERLQFPKQKAELYLGLDVGAVYGCHISSEPFVDLNTSCHQNLFFHDPLIKIAVRIDFADFKNIHFFLQNFS